jgi:hypothetical protein
MARASTEWTNKKILERRKAGYGQGRLENYKPWLNVRDFSSIGTTYRLYSPKLGRPVVLFSNIERNAFLLVESLSRFADFWEQYPLDRRQTVDIARSLGVDHPEFMTTRRPAILTLDGLFTPHDGPPEVIDCKPKKLLDDCRTMEKLAIRREYANRMGYVYRLFTEESIPRTVVHNLQWIRLSVQRKGEKTVSELDQRRLTKSFVEALTETRHMRPKMVLGEFLTNNDSALSAPKGFSQWALRKLMWAHKVAFDLEVPFRGLLDGPINRLVLHPVLHEARSGLPVLKDAPQSTLRRAA